MLTKLKKKGILTFLLCSIFFIFSTLSYSLIVLKQRTIYKGILISGISVSGLSKEEAHAHIIANLKTKLEKQITLRYKEKEWHIGIKDLIDSIDLKKALDEAFLQGRQDNVIRRIYQITKLKIQPCNINLHVSVNKTKIESLLKTIKQDVDTPAKNAHISLEDQKVIIIPEQTGCLLNTDANVKLISNYINSNNQPSDITLEVDPVIPKLKSVDLTPIDKVISTCNTRFNRNDVNRSYNIGLSTSRLTNVYLAPGEVFSLDKCMGQRTVKNGYKMAPTIYNGDFVQGIGGGICQVASTLYCAALKAKLTIVERAPHSMLVSYIDPGQDATISEKNIDLKLRNNSKYPIYIMACIKQNILSINILGKKETEEIVTLQSVITKQYSPTSREILSDETVPLNQTIVCRNAKSGAGVIVYRHTYSKDLLLLKSEKISEYIYQPVAEKVKVNPYAMQKSNTHTEESSTND